MKLVLIGTGNTATVLGRKFKAAGHSILQLFGRSDHGSLLASELGAEYLTNTDLIATDADVILLAITDIAVADEAKKLSVQHGVLAHTAGSIPIDVLQNSAAEFGVFYPLQTLNKNTKHLPQIPVVVSGSSSAAIETLTVLATSISPVVRQADDTQRFKLHLSAVFVNNFVNHIYAVVKDYCKSNNVDFTVLQPLIEETSSRIRTLSPVVAQTGPARRNDIETINRHLQMLEDEPVLSEMYRMFTRSIQSLHHQSGK